jgi:hypothetical protein
MILAYFAPFFAWSWTGHGTLTSVGVGVAIMQLITFGKSAILAQLAKLNKEVWHYDDEGGPDAVREAEITKQVADEIGSMPGDAAAAAALFSDLPTRVQVEDIHPTNIPKVGAWIDLDSTGQVKHFMRSKEQVSSEEAYLASCAYIRSSCVSAWQHLKQAVHPGSGWGDKLHDALFVPNAVGDANQAKHALAMALHTVEDSFAPGHVRRIIAYIIEEVHIWDDENKNAHDDWPGHEALDNPEHPMSRPYFDAAKRAVGDFIGCILLNLDETEHDFRTELDLVMAKHLARGSLAPDLPVTPQTTATG